MDIQEFENLRDSKNKSVVVISASWCGPCQVLARQIHNLSGELQSRIFKVDADENFELVDKLGVKSVPSVFYLGEGRVSNSGGDIASLSAFLA